MKTEIALALIMISVTSLQAAQEVPPSGSKLGSVTGGVFKEAHLVIDNKCVSCHTSQRIEQALAAGKNMQEIQHRMEQKGVKLTADEQTVLGIFWKDSPLRKKK
ncbi:cytochrome C [Geoanaerobacter pelophilus]|uniref:Cytochrome C n=1 Tax=Geoanaerobacter pelophilus TaxID=60036 RepID=A0ABQ0MK75_9BACT|nr:cytochrome C [Geoanaerobacter pelophilus]GAW67491.1 cytochrome C [Geoanaerobacter pelophilus]